jgi:hypothetical protein
MFGRVAFTLETLPGATVALLVDGLAGEGDEAAFRALLSENAADLVWIAPERLDQAGITAADNEAEAMAVTVIRAPDAAPRAVTVAAFDEQGRRIAEGGGAFAPGEVRTTVGLAVPFELRNDFSALSIEGAGQAAAMRVLDENSRRRRVGLLSAAEGDQAQPLLSPLYYIRRALLPFADLIEPGTRDLAEAIPELIERKPAIIVMADIGIIPDSARLQLIEWVEKGGTLLRFAGPRLAAAGDDPDLLPVRLRTGERALGGTLSWTEPQPVAEFPPQGPFYDLPRPSEVFVRRQVLAEPGPDIVERTWASLGDGTPLVTGARRGDGSLVLVHVTPEATWSDLPISGSFVAMLRRLVQLSRNQGRIEQAADGSPVPLAPYRMIAADGGLVPPPPDARPLVPAPGVMPVTIDNPPGLYGSGEGVVAHNLLHAGSLLEPLEAPQTTLPVTKVAYAFDESRNLKAYLLVAASALLALDFLAVFWIGGLFARTGRTASARAVAALAAIALVTVMAPGPAFSQTDDSRPGDADAIAAISKTRIGYVLTGNAAIDSVSRAGIAGLNRFLIEKTALEPGEPAGVDPATDELSFYPLIYWPIDPDVPVPEDAAIARIDAYMQQGGTVLFDTRDRHAGGFGAGSGATPATLRLREILASLNIPPLEPVPEDHVLSKSFYILREFPGRFADAPLWVEASLGAENLDNRPVRTGDGVSPIMITAADFAGAWAIDSSGNPLFPTVPADPMQRVYAFRAGVNIMMYMLTGNYKSDQVHLPILLERLGQ